MSQRKQTIGRTAEIVIMNEGEIKVPAKVDTGADSSSIWASELNVDDSGCLSFVLFDKLSPYYTGKKHATDLFTVNLIRNSTGDTQVRYKVKLDVKINNRRIKGSFTLSDRSSNSYPVLIGCRLLKGRFLVDVEIGEPDLAIGSGLNLRSELRRDPKAFFEKYHVNNHRGDVNL